MRRERRHLKVTLRRERRHFEGKWRGERRHFEDVAGKKYKPASNEKYLSELLLLPLILHEII